jgi:hypothetical protein
MRHYICRAFLMQGAGTRREKTKRAHQAPVSFAA